MRWILERLADFFIKFICDCGSCRRRKEIETLERLWKLPPKKGMKHCDH